MLNLVNVENISIDELKSKIYDIGIFASGYESRSTFLIKNFDQNNINHKIALGFETFQENPIRKLNDQIYIDKLFSEIKILSHDNVRPIYKLLINILEKQKNQEKTINILLDFASMPRIWYSGILNFFRLQKNYKFDVFLNYTPGVYMSKDFRDYSYSDIPAIPFHEGSLSSNSETLLVLGIGFSPYLVKSVIEFIEPNEILGILPIPSFEEDYDKLLIKIREDILTKDITNWIHCPVNNLETIFRIYAEITSSSIDSKDILFLSLGPKILTMASLLVSQRFHQVTCLYLKTPKHLPQDVQPTGDFICNRISYS